MTNTEQPTEIKTLTFTQFFDRFVSNWEQTFYHQGTPQLVKLLNDKPIIKEKYLQAHEIAKASVFSDRYTITVIYKNNKVQFRLRVQSNSYAKQNYIKRYKSLYRKLKEDIEDVFQFAVE
jgi:stress-induced morphogen